MSLPDDDTSSPAMDMSEEVGEASKDSSLMASKETETHLSGALVSGQTSVTKQVSREILQQSSFLSSKQTEKLLSDASAFSEMKNQEPHENDGIIDDTFWNHPEPDNLANNNNAAGFGDAQDIQRMTSAQRDRDKVTMVPTPKSGKRNKAQSNFSLEVYNNNTLNTTKTTSFSQSQFATSSSLSHQHQQQQQESQVDDNFTGAKFWGGLGSNHITINTGNLLSSGGILGDGFGDLYLGKGMSAITDWQPIYMVPTSEAFNNIGGENTLKTTNFSQSLPAASSSLSHQQQQLDWTIKKKLTKTDVSHYAKYLRLIKKDVDKHILTHLSVDDRQKLRKGEGVKVNVHDHDTDTEHKLLLKYWESYTLSADWESNGSCWVQDFIVRRKLKKGDEIELYWNGSASRLHFRVAPAEEKKP